MAKRGRWLKLDRNKLCYDGRLAYDRLVTDDKRGIFVTVDKVKLSAKYLHMCDISHLALKNLSPAAMEQYCAERIKVYGWSIVDRRRILRKFVELYIADGENAL